MNERQKLETQFIFKTLSKVKKVLNLRYGSKQHLYYELADIERIGDYFFIKVNLADLDNLFEYQEYELLHINGRDSFHIGKSKNGVLLLDKETIENNSTYQGIRQYFPSEIYDALKPFESMGKVLLRAMLSTIKDKDIAKYEASKIEIETMLEAQPTVIGIISGRLGTSISSYKNIEGETKNILLNSEFIDLNTIKEINAQAYNELTNIIKTQGINNYKLLGFDSNEFFILQF